MDFRSPFEPFFSRKAVVTLDGGLATELEKAGHDLNNVLWSAKLLESNPAAIRDVHLSYLQAGSQCITTASYQASVDGFVKAGYSSAVGTGLIEKSVDLAKEARDIFSEIRRKQQCPVEISPLIAGSIGPYAAFLADGSEYNGQYPIQVDGLYRFHMKQWNILTRLQLDLVAIETIPNRSEAEAFRRIISEFPQVPTWISFACRNGQEINDGTLICDCASLFNDLPNLVAIGVNCTAPQFVSSLIREIRSVCPDKRIVVYPNSGETYNPKTKDWIGDPEAVKYLEMVRNWYRDGASLIGGCCRTGPDHIRGISAMKV